MGWRRITLLLESCHIFAEASRHAKSHLFAHRRHASIDSLLIFWVIDRGSPPVPIYVTAFAIMHDSI